MNRNFNPPFDNEERLSLAMFGRSALSNLIHNEPFQIARLHYPKKKDAWIFTPSYMTLAMNYEHFSKK